MYLYRATKDPYFLEVGRDMLHSIESSARTPCGYATVSTTMKIVIVFVKALFPSTLRVIRVVKSPLQPFCCQAMLLFGETIVA